MSKLRVMKDSGVTWIGDVPSEWDIVKIKHPLKERKENNKPKRTDSILSLTKDRGVIPYSEKGDIGNKSKENLEDYKLAYPDDIVLNSMNVIIGSVGLSKYFGAVSPVYYMLYKRFISDDIRYFNYLFQTEQFQKFLVGYGNGILAHRMRIQMQKLNSVMIPYPNHMIQHVIVSYLDQHLLVIDKIIHKTKESLEEYKKFKEVLITETVTKGLNPNVNMKDSGVEWIGLIPEHSTMIKLKRLVKIFNGKETKTDTGDFPVYGSGGIFKYTNDYLFDGVSLLFGRKGTIDKPIIVEGKFWTVDTMFYSEISNLVIPKYMYYLSIGVINFDYYKSGSVLPSITQFELENVMVPYFSKDYQRSIVDFLDNKLMNIDMIMDKKMQLIDNLVLFKKSLIYECVTGKKK